MTIAATSQPLVTLDSVGYRKGNCWLVQNISLRVRAGEIVTLIGLNGAGKSTTAKLALGILQPTSGKCVRAPHLRVGYLPQRMHLDWAIPLNVERLMCLTNKPTHQQITAALEATGVAHLQDAKVEQLSGGELQRVLLARAIAREPNLLVLDEPVQGVDMAGELALYALISNIRKQTGCGILMISHDLHMVMAATDHVVCINGHICCEGTPGSVMSNTQYKQLFGIPGDTLAVYQHHHNHTHLPDGRVLTAGEETINHSHHQHK